MTQPPADDLASQSRAAATPLVEQLTRVPANARLEVENHPTSHSMFPVGRMCHEAAAELTSLREALAETHNDRADLKAMCDELAGAVEPFATIIPRSTGVDLARARAIYAKYQQEQGR